MRNAISRRSVAVSCLVHERHHIHRALARGSPGALRGSPSIVRIGFECTAIRPGRSGIGHATERLLSALAAALPPEDELWALTNADPPLGLLTAPTVRPLRPTALWLQAAVPRVARRMRLDLYHFTNSTAPVFFAAPYVVTIYDASLIRFPETHPLRRRAYQRTLLWHTARRAIRIITISQASARDVVEFLGVPVERVVVTPLAADGSFRPVRDADRLASVLERHGLRDPYMLYVGNIEPRKNLVRLIEAFARMDACDVKLALAGGRAWMSRGVDRRIRELGLDGRVRLLGYVPDEDLPALYSGALAFAYPSLWEGFGLPVLEAMACGTPVVTSNRSSLVEIAEGAARLVDPCSVDAIAEALQLVISSAAERVRLSAAGLERAARYSWAKTAAMTIDTYRDALAECGI